MKIRFLLAFIFLLVEFSMLFAQKYEPLLEERKTWDVFYWKDDSFIPTYAGSRFFVEGDTIYNNHSYQILRSRSFFSYQQNPNLFISPYGLGNASFIAGLIREDTTERKVFYKDFQRIPSPPEELIYDFSLEVGDTFVVYLVPYYRFVLDSITLIIDERGTPRRMFNFSSPNLGHRLLPYIEGLGGSGGLTSPLCVCFEAGSQLTCVQKDNMPLYPFGSSTCNITVGVEDKILENQILLYPNPINNQLFINGLENQTGNIIIYDSLGKILFTQAFEHPFETVQIDLSAIPKGILFCKIQSEQGSITKKVIKN